jgi:hypothetical protein|tara:strand:+ start:2375 stop:2602 length:228 start_codon:yes stop_codon:yes gene_type:complete
MSRQLVPPTFSLPPEEYDVRYFNDLIRSLSQLVTQLQNPGELRGTKITLTDLPTSDEGLETGALFNDNGTIKVKT